MFGNFIDFWKICIIMLLSASRMKKRKFFKNEEGLCAPNVRLRDIKTTKRQYLGNCWKAIKLMIWDGDVFIESFKNIIYLRTFLNQQRTLEMADIESIEIPIWSKSKTETWELSNRTNQLNKVKNNNGQDNQQQ